VAASTALLQLKASEPLIRLAALRSLEVLNMSQRMQYVWPLITDPVKAIRLEAIRLLAPVGGNQNALASLSAVQRQGFNKGVKEYIATANTHSDAPSGQAQLGVMYQTLREFDKALLAYERALIIEPDFIPALLNIADVHRQRGQDTKGIKVLKQAINIDAKQSASHFALGLLYIRLKDINQALSPLKRASELADNNPHYSYVYGVALYESGQTDLAVGHLQSSLKRFPGNPQIKAALTGYLRR